MLFLRNNDGQSMITNNLVPSILILALINATVSADELSDNNQQQPTLLTEKAFLQQVKRNHPLLELAYLRQQAASAERLEKQGVFDPVMKASSGFKRFNSSAKLGQVQEVVESKFSIDFLTRYGILFSTGVKQAIGDIKNAHLPYW